MATNESTASRAPTESTSFADRHAFSPVSYGNKAVDRARLPGCTVQRFADTVEAVSTGSASILQLLEWDSLRGDDHETDPESQPPAVLNAFHRSALLRMVAANMEMLSDQANELKIWAFTQHTDEGRAQELASAMRLVKRYQDATAD